MTMDIKAYLGDKRTIVDEALKDIFAEPEGYTADIVAAMKYSLFAGGKRVRPILCMAAAEAVGGVEKDVLPLACALELIHTYSLIHDDLPVMDDDELRRGKPTNHKVFGEALALLAGDGLLTESFKLMARMDLKPGLEPSSLLRAIALVAEAAGYQGMVGGQVLDIQWEGKDIDTSLVGLIHRHKTGALIAASATAGAVMGGGNEEEIRKIEEYGGKIGLAFQIADDILDIEGDTMTLGKTAGVDEKRKKITYPAAIGIEPSKSMARQLVEEAVNALAFFRAEADPLIHLAWYIIERKR
jgi:geranylgeranyl diphosphate synthase type II